MSFCCLARKAAPDYPEQSEQYRKVSGGLFSHVTSSGAVTVVGGGILGLCCSWELLRRGVAVRVLEAETIGAGSSGGHVGALAPHAPENWNEKKAFQLDSLLMAGDFWAGIEKAAGLATGYGRTGRLQPVESEAAAVMLRGRIAASEQQWPAGLGMRLTDRPGSPLFPASPSGVWLEDLVTARINPRAALAALAGAIRAEGGDITEQSPACPEDLAGIVIWATGTPGLEMLSRELQRPVGKGIKGQSALLRHDAAGMPQVFADGIHIVPHEDGTVAVGSTSENEFTHGETDERLDDIIARARKICPQLETAPVLDRWSGLRPRARSRAPLLGAWPGREGHFVANGGFKIGFGMAPKIAAVMADLILDGTDRIPEGFRLT